jgi:hypothetical protein
MGSKSTQSTQIPAYIEEAGKLALQRAQEIQAMGYVPYMGPEVAAINPYEQALATNVGSMASAFGLAAPVGMDMGGMPTVTQGGMTGYSSYPAYMASLERLRETRPEMYEYLSGMTRFDPITGALNPEYDARMQAAIAPQVVEMMTIHLSPQRQRAVAQVNFSVASHQLKICSMAAVLARLGILIAQEEKEARLVGLYLEIKTWDVQAHSQRSQQQPRQT